ncbi:MAG: S1/P1 nuclease [Alistipes sp.]|nr:S1/P1 nuclease [Alistipes sp.]
MKKNLLLSVMSLFISAAAMAWGQKGHDVVASIAEAHLTPAAAARVTAILDNHSPVYYSNWMDNASHTDEYRYTSPWHYANIDEGYTFATMPRNPEGDVISALEMITAALEQGGLEPAQEQLYLKMLIHFMGDLHCPMHTGRKSDRGGNNVQIFYFTKETNLHSIWDTDLVESAHRWSYTEWREQIDRLTDEQAAAIVEGDYVSWLNEASEISRGIYEKTPEGTRVSFDYIAEYAPVIEQQFVRGGHRLAAVLNRIYDK